MVARPLSIASSYYDDGRFTATFGVAWRSRPVAQPGPKLPQYLEAEIAGYARSIMP